MDNGLQGGQTITQRQGHQFKKFFLSSNQETWMAWTTVVPSVKKKRKHFKRHPDSIVDWVAGEGIKGSIHIPALESLMHGNEEGEQGFGEESDPDPLFLIIPLNSQPLNSDIQTGSLKKLNYPWLG